MLPCSGPAANPPQRALARASRCRKKPRPTAKGQPGHAASGGFGQCLRFFSVRVIGYFRSLLGLALRLGFLGHGLRRAEHRGQPAVACRQPLGLGGDLRLLELGDGN